MTKQILVGGLPVGGGAPVSIQSMTNTPTQDVEATVAQIRRLAAAGCQIVRVAVPNLEAAKAVGDVYPERRSMVMDGCSTMLGSLFGNPFPTTVYFGHPGWKELGARAGFSLVNAGAYLLICLTGLTGVLMALIPTEAVMVLLIFVGFSVTASTFQELDKKYVNVVLLSLIPILFQYIQTQISSSVQAAGTTVDALTAAQFAEYSVPINGIQYLGNGAFLSSLLLAGLLAYVLDKKYFHAASFAAALAWALGLV